MKLVEILLPVFEHSGRKTPNARFAQTRRELLQKFGGLTAYSRVPARGFWKQSGAVARDDIVVFEVMIKRLERAWWGRYRRSLEKRFRQDLIVIRVSNCSML